MAGRLLRLLREAVVNLDPQHHLPPGRRAYEQARRLLRAKRRYWASKAHASEHPGVVLQFPNKKEARE